jgi:hypothetical protein
MTMTALEPIGKRWKSLADLNSVYIYCANLAFDAATGLYRLTVDRPFAPHAGTIARFQTYPTSIILPCGGASRSQNADFFTAYCG